MVDFSKMRNRITLKKPSKTKLNSIKEQTPVYEKIATVWAEIVPLRGREYQESQKLQTETQYRVTIRYRTDIKANWRIDFGDKLLQISNILDTDSLQEQLEIMCFEVEKE